MKDVLTKLKFKTEGIVINAPKEIEKEFVLLGLASILDKSQKSTSTIVFVNELKEFVDFLSGQLKYIESDSVLWFAYPKGSSGIKTDINRDILRVKAEEYGISTVTAISIDDTWSALRFRPSDKVGK
jgi:hypothetical protein